ncbi:phosphate-starvation-inducible protein PsiE [Lactobacillus sp. 3B(2020)]|uniref:phosphate-starvation-inducible protein PsiE n=1 Tax=Lactobacillus sp. 3B(2020) TaxID=2695882 RepID=UPI0015DF1E53|nr:phosphate-starvation-inducible protein PsiE [Lactobacillus sp. 3B(2020)]QLL70761.1 phosphate-starvation-inducible protein PsiE [Lactobacillus sp. 3B(2020)]
MKKFYQWADKIGALLQVLSLICISLLGLALIYFMVDELITVVKISTVTTATNYYLLLEGVVTFFLFFEFVAMVINILRNGGHISVNFLLGLGITALVRWLITEHEKSLDDLIVSLAVLALVGSTILLAKFVHED